MKRPVTFGEVFIATHTRADGSFVDHKSQQVGEAYAKSLEERMSEIDRDGPQISDNYSQHSTQRTLSLEEKNEIFLKVIHFCFYLLRMLVFVCLEIMIVLLFV